MCLEYFMLSYKFVTQVILEMHFLKNNKLKTKRCGSFTIHQPITAGRFGGRVLNSDPRKKTHTCLNPMTVAFFGYRV